MLPRHARERLQEPRRHRVGVHRERDANAATRSALSIRPLPVTEAERDHGVVLEQLDLPSQAHEGLPRLGRPHRAQWGSRAMYLSQVDSRRSASV